MPFTFVFEGGFFDLERLFRQLTAFTVQRPSGSLVVSGRLLTIQGVKLSPATGASEKSGSPQNNLTGTITASAYVLPAGQGLTGSATPSSPTGASAPASASPGASASTGKTSPVPTAMARVP